MKSNHEVYLFGQVLGTHSFLLKGGFLRPDEYSEIAEQYFLPGGETGTAATVLASLGVSVRMDGTFIGAEVAPMLKAFYAGKSVDLSSLRFTEDKGVMDYVVIAGLVRSPMGRFQTLFSTGERWWSVPREEDIAGCKAAAVDPYFGDESLLAAALCRRHGVPFVTIDSPHGSPLHRQAAVNVVSKECVSEHYAGMAPEAIMALMQRETDGLTILTQGGGEMLYARKGGPIHRMKPFSVTVKSTLGAGDTFKACCVYGLLHGMKDEELVRFASACAAVAISRFPLPLNPPRLEEVQELISPEAQHGSSRGRSFGEVYDIEKISRGPYDIWKIYERHEATMYLVCGSQRACLIDTGYGLMDLKELVRKLTKLPVFVINTHGHVDHVLGNHWFDKVLMHPADQGLYREIADGYADMLAQDWVKQSYGEFTEGLDPSTVRFPRAEDIRGGDVIDLGGKRLEVVELPGHTAGSIMLLDRDEKLCFSGDAIIEHLWMFLEESLPPETYLHALTHAVEALRASGIERIYDGHYAHRPLTLADTGTMLSGMQQICSGTARGKPFENKVGSGVEYAFGDWSVLCCDKTDLPA